MFNETHAFAGDRQYAVGLREDLVVNDAGRDRTIEVTVRYPTTAAAFGAIVWCHGLGGSRHSTKTLTELWANHGYVVIQPTFLDSIETVATEHPELGVDPRSDDRRNWAQNPKAREFMVATMLQPTWWVARVRDVGVILDQLEHLLDNDPAFNGTIDLSRIGVGGHSFGAYTSQLIGGVTIDHPDDGPVSFRDERVRAVVVASGQGRNQGGLREGSWDTLDCPMLNITGSLDWGATSDDPNWKREPFLFAPPGDKYQAFMDGADHGLGGITEASPMFASVPDQLRLVEQVSLAFWHAFVSDDAEAKAWLDSDAPEQLLYPELSFERR